MRSGINISHGNFLRIAGKIFDAVLMIAFLALCCGGVLLLDAVLNNWR